MSKERTLEQIKVMQAYVDGKEIEWLNEEYDEWDIDPDPDWNWDEFSYRVKEEPVYVPFTLEDDIESLLGKAVRHKTENHVAIISGVDKTDTVETFYITKFWFSLRQSFEYLTFADGKPFGKLK